MIGTVCRGCKRPAEIVYVDDVGESFCVSCTQDLPMPSETLGLQYLIGRPPFHTGDRVECRTAGEMFDGVGTVREISYDIAHGGTMIYPAWRVEIDEPANENSPTEGWYTEVCLTRVGSES